jgi:hypothetical protein
LENVTSIRSVQLPAFIQQRIRHVYRLCAAARLGPARRRLRPVDAVNTFSRIRRSFHVISRCFASSNATFPHVSRLFAGGSIPGSSTV